MENGKVVVGVDVGGTNTDAVVLRGGKILSSHKTTTSDDVTSGIVSALESALRKVCDKQPEVERIHIGTTHFLNAILQHKHLQRVAVIRLCGKASTNLPPFADFPLDLKQVLDGGVHMVGGGFHFDGQREITPLNRTEIEETVKKIRDSNVKNVVISGLFSPINNEQEIQVGEWVRESFPEVSLTLSHSIGQIGVLLRENSAILNESLKALAADVIGNLSDSFRRKQIHAPVFLTQNDGTLLSSEQALKTPVLTLAAGPTNSMRGAAILSGEKDAIVADIGGTSTDVGLMSNGFPRPASTKIQVAEVQTNFQMPETVSIALGGGSRIRVEGETVRVGPDSVGNKIVTEALVFGGKTLTCTDIAVASGHADVGTQKSNAESIVPELREKVMKEVRRKLEKVVTSVKTSAEPLPLILVGGGSDVIDSSWELEGISRIIKPPNYSVANAVGAAACQVSGSVDVIEKIDSSNDVASIKKRAADRATKIAIENGADPATVEILNLYDVPLAYLPGNATRVVAKAVGDLLCSALSTATPESSSADESGAMKVGQDEVDREPQKLTTNQAKQTVISEMTASVPAATNDSAPVKTDDVTPLVESSTGAWVLRPHDVECLAVGSGILGCGGGGSPYFAKLQVLRKMAEGKEIRVITPQRYARDAGADEYAVPLCYMGAPTVVQELMSSAVEMESALKAMQQQTCLAGRRMTAVFTPEAAGMNAMEPLIVAADMGLPVLDCDAMGRAFPELQMCTYLIYGHPPCPVALGDCNGSSVVVTSVDKVKTVENICRQVCIEMGCSVALVDYPLTPDDVLQKCVQHPLSRGWRLGNAVLSARAAKRCPVSTIVAHEGGTLLFRAKLTDVTQRTEGGFSRGEMTCQGLEEFDGRRFVVNFQNEFLIAMKMTSEKIVLATVPDLITVVALETGEPIPTDELRFGLRVAVVVLPASPLLTTAQALKVVSPAAFGYPDIEYKSCGEYIEHDPIPRL